MEKHLFYYTQHSQFVEPISKPSVSYCEQEDEIHYHPIEYIDLGLPSGTLWATMNVGAENPEDFGDYFAWGELETKENYSWNTYKFTETPIGETVTLSKYTAQDTIMDLEIEDDVAFIIKATSTPITTVRIPTEQQCQELLDSCNWVNSTKNGISGCTVTGTNGNSIFLPYCGFYDGADLKGVGNYVMYWSRTWKGTSLSEEQKARVLCYLPNNAPANAKSIISRLRYIGYPIRSVNNPG